MRLALEQAGAVDFERIALHHAQLAGKRLAQFGERGDAAVVTLDRRHARAGAEQCPRQPARPRPDLEHFGIGQVAGNACDPRQQLRVEQEVLAQRLARVEAMARDHLAQRRQFWLGHASAAARRSAASPARRIAAIVAPGSARSLPAMSNAVP